MGKVVLAVLIMGATGIILAVAYVASALRIPKDSVRRWVEPEDGFGGISGDSYLDDLALSLRNRPVIG